MTALREAAQAVLDRWDSPAWEWAKQGPTAALMADLRAALAQQEQAEPVAWRVGKSYWTSYESIPSALLPPANTPQPLFATPPRREWQGLSDAWKCACGANLYIDAEGNPRSRANG